MPSTYTPLANLTLSASAASVTFSSISQAYHDLVLVVTPIASAAAAGMQMQFNNDTSANYNYVTMQGNPTASSAASNDTVIRVSDGGYVNNSATNSYLISVQDYSATDKHKSTLMRGNNSVDTLSAGAGRWASTAAITAIKLFIPTTTFAAGSTFALYGIAS